MLFILSVGRRIAQMIAWISAFGVLTLSSACADDLDALNGETVRVIIGSSAGGTTDTTARHFIDSLKALLPETTIRVQNIDGSGGAKAVKELQEAHGSITTVAIFNYGPIYGQLISPDVAPYDLNRTQWIGALAKVQRVLVIRSGLGGSSLDTIRDLDRQATIATSDTFSNSTIESLLLNAMFDLRMKVIRGTKRSQREALLLAGDIDADLGTPFDLAPKISSGTVFPVLRFSRNTVSESLAGVPAIADIVPDTVPDELVFLMETLDKTGRLVAAAPTTDPHIVDALRAAFDQITSDRNFVKNMADMRLLIDPTSGVELTDRLEKVLGKSSGDLKNAVQSYLQCGEKMSDEGAAGCN